MLLLLLCRRRRIRCFESDCTCQLNVKVVKAKKNMVNIEVVLLRTFWPDQISRCFIIGSFSFCQRAFFSQGLGQQHFPTI
jgi:hypothetical protein